MKKAIMKLLFRLAIAIALWAMTDKTKAKISRGMAEKIGELYRRMKQRMSEQEEQTPDPTPDNAQGDNAPRLFGNIRKWFRRINGSAGSDGSDFEL